jgi:CTP:molybdopterin cytidylyltransferase MocA
LIGGVVLAAGGASRFGSPKQLAELDERAQLQHAVDAMLAVPAIDPVVVVERRLGDRHDAGERARRLLDRAGLLELLNGACCCDERCS